MNAKRWPTGCASIIDFEQERERYHAEARRRGGSGDLGPAILAQAGLEVLGQLDEAEALLRDLGVVAVDLVEKPGEANLSPSEISSESDQRTDQEKP